MPLWMYLLLKIAIISRNQGMFAHDGTVLNGEELPSGTKTHHCKKENTLTLLLWQRSCVDILCLLQERTPQFHSRLACAETILDDCNMKI